MLLEKFVTQHGDEFITCCVAEKHTSIIKNSAAYINRYWTDSFYLCSTSYYYNQICVIHLPNEKELGMLKAFEIIYKTNKTISIDKIQKIFNLPKYKVKRKLNAKKIINKIKRIVKNK